VRIQCQGPATWAEWITEPNKPGIAYGECMASEIHLPISGPRPPHDNFAIAVGVANHAHAEKKAGH